MSDPVQDEFEDEYEDEEEIEEIDVPGDELEDEAVRDLAKEVAAAARAGARAESQEGEVEGDEGEELGEGEDGEDDEVEDEEEDEGEEDEGEEEADEEEEEEEEEVAPDWVGLRSLPEQPAVVEALLRAKDEGRKELTVLLLGKSGVGKSSTVNSLLGEKAAAVSAFKLQPDTESSTVISRQVVTGGPLDGFKLRLIDTCGLEDPEAGDTINYTALQRIAEDIRGRPIDVVLYCDRLDLYRVEPLDKRMMLAVSSQFGRQIWRKTVLVLTHGNLQQPPPGTTFDSFSDRRIRLLQRAVRGPLFRPALPAVIVENADSCPVNALRQRVLPDGEAWVPALADAAVDMALSSGPYKWRAGLASKPNNSYKWLIPVLCYGQYLAWKLLLEPQLRKDGDLQARLDEETWREKAAERKRLGIGPPLKPDATTAWRLEQMYEDD